MPTLFIRDGFRLRPDPEATAEAARRSEIARQYRTLTEPKVFCDPHLRPSRSARYRLVGGPGAFDDRIDYVEAYQDLLRGTGAYVLAVEQTDYSDKVTDPQYGKSRLLEELAAQAVRDGHVPCLAAFSGPIPSQGWDVALEVTEAILQARERFGLQAVREHELNRLERRAGGAAVPLHPLVERQLLTRRLPPDGDVRKIHDAVVGAALRAEVCALAAEVRGSEPALAGAKVVVLLDRVHLLAQAASVLVSCWLDQHGLGVHGDPAPVVFVFSGVDRKGFGETIRSYIQDRGTTFRRLDLKEFPSPAEDQLPYHQLMLCHDPPLVLALRWLHSDQGQLDRILKHLHDVSNGVPSKFAVMKNENREVRTALEAFLSIGVLEKADDERILDLMKGGGNAGT